MTAIANHRARRANERALWPRRARTLVQVVAGALLVAALGAGAGWLFHLEQVIGVGPGRATVKFISVVCIALLAAALLSTRRWFRGACFGAVVVIAALVLLEYAFSLDLGIDELVVEDWSGGAETAFPGRPAETTAFSLVVLGVAGLLTDAGRRTSAQVLLGLPLLVGMTALFGYTYGVEDLYQVGSHSTMAVSTAVAVVASALAIWFSVPHGILQWLAFGTDPGARLQRVLVPVALLLIPFAGLLHVRALRDGRYEVPFGMALLISFVALVVTVVGYWAGRRAFMLDRERDTLLDELQRVNDELEDRVRVRSHQLNRQRTKLALFEERDRIARDLHDRVIQRIFAAGLQVASLSRTAHKDAARRGEEDSAVAANLHLVATELDLAIRELRNSIFELTSIDDHANVEQVVRDVASRASRILGFMPRIEVTGEVAGIPGEIVAQLASVMQEGLSNVARHAQASAAEVAVHATESYLQVRITDDGVGLPDPLPRSSGISNLMNRARSHGGTATWANGSPSGTVLVWRVPRPGDPAGESDQGNDTPVAFSESDHSPAASSRS